MISSPDAAAMDAVRGDHDGRDGGSLIEASPGPS
jgi:hypothetical protein